MDITDHMDLENIRMNYIPAPLPDRPSRRDVVVPIISKVDERNLVETVKDLSSYYTRYYTTDTGVEAAYYIRDKFNRYINESRRTDIKVRLFEHSWRQPSVIARIEGNGPDKNEVVIISAHEDSVNSGAFGRAPGADDDASGVSCVLEAFRVIASSGYKPSRSIEFHTYAAEEIGLRGSQAIVESYKLSNVAVHAHLQLDMTMYTKNPSVITIMTDNVDTQLTEFLKKLVPEYTNKNIELSRCGYACSDHASWNRAGYRTCMPAETLFELTNPNIHSSYDTLDNLNPNHGVQYAIIAASFLVELS